mgnify:CR=1 FL=1
MVNKFDVIITGSEGVIGKDVSKFLKKTKKLNVLCLDLVLGHDLNDEAWTKEFFKENKADSLINLFALNEHITDNQNLNKSLHDFPLSEINKFLETNITSLFSVCRNFSFNNSKGSIINFSSIYGLTPPKLELYEGSLKHVGYCVSKAGVIALSEYLATILAPNFRVNTIAPGGILSKQSDNFINRYSSYCPMGRMGVQSDIFGILELLISNNSSYITGETFRVDGGWAI